MKKGMLFGLSHREKRAKKINLLHFPVFTSKSFMILKLREPFTDLALTSDYICLQKMKKGTYCVY